MMKYVTQKNINKVISLVIALILISCFATFAFAAEPDPFAGTAVTEIMSNILKILYRLFQYIGAILAVWGVGQFLLSVKNDDADSKSRAIKIIVAAVAAISIGTIADAIGLEEIITGTA